MSAEAHQEILRTEGLSKFFPGVKALDNVNFSLRRGEIMPCWAKTAPENRL